jgi:hypothetical protein
VKAAAGMRMNSMEPGDGGMMPNFGSGSAGMQISMGNGGGPILVESLMMAGGGENGGQHQHLQQQQQQQNGRRKLYFSSGNDLKDLIIIFNTKKNSTISCK